LKRIGVQPELHKYVISQSRSDLTLIQIIDIEKCSHDKEQLGKDAIEVHAAGVLGSPETMRLVRLSASRRD
jgi:hypothetical protein